MDAPTDTIVAVATPPGRGGVGIVRASGPLCAELAAATIGAVPAERQAHLATFRDGAGATIDQGLALFFRGPRSFTGEDVLELHGHGSPVVLDLLVRRLQALGARPARPGEFSQRAFLNGKIDLAQAEAIADLINSATVENARAAERTLQGALSAGVNAIAGRIAALRTLQEAYIDFADDLVPGVDEAGPELAALLTALQRLLAEAAQGQILNEGLRLVIAGPPNAGKSSLINALCGCETAIVSDIAGTTRDVIRESVNIDGIPVHLADTAGLQDTSDPIERLGIDRTHAEMGLAELVLYMVDCRRGLSAHDHGVLAALAPGTRALVVLNKTDLTAEPPATGEQDGRRAVRLSVRSGAGLDLLKTEIKAALGLRETTGLYAANRRHLDALERCHGHLREAARNHGEGRGFELVAEELRLAHAALGEIVGAFTTEDLLDGIFSSFCIGK